MNEKFLGLTKSSAARLFLLLSVIAITVLIYLVGIRVDRTNADVKRNKQVLAYICSTTSVLDRLVVTAHDQIETSLSNGTYQRLHLPKENIKAARETVTAYAIAHRILKNNGACRELGEK